MNGEGYSVNTLEKISWERFKQLPTGLKEEYLRAIMDRFGVGMANISRDLFGCESACLYQHCKRYGVRVNATKGGKIAKSTLDRWHSWINSDLDVVPNPSDAPVSETPEEPHHSVNTICYEPSSEPAEEIKPFRAHDYDDMFKDIGMERDIPAPSVPAPATFPATGLSITLEGTPSEILSSLIAMVPTVLDFGKSYRFNLKVDTYLDFTRRNDL